jgi:hypothetical protein
LPSKSGCIATGPRQLTAQELFGARIDRMAYQRANEWLGQ